MRYYLSAPDFDVIKSKRIFKWNITILMAILLFSFSVVCHAQTPPTIYQTPNILPPSPTASELGKYGLLPVSMFTGTPNVEIPLYVYKTKNLSIPISLSYNSNGVKVDEISGWTGLSWALNSGGVTSRIVRDDPDEFNNGIAPPYPETLNISDAETLQYIEYVGNTDEADTEPDLYTYNFLGHTGKFVFDRNGHAVTMPHTNLRIEKYYGSNYSGSIVITTPDGVKHTFSAVELSSTSGAAPNEKSYDEVQTSWYLTKLEHPQGDVITLTYGYANYFVYGLTMSQTITKNTGAQTCGGVSPQCPEIDDVTMPISLKVRGLHLSKIESSNYGSVEFLATQDRSDINDFKLNEIHVKDVNGNFVKGFTLDYRFISDRMFLMSVSEGDHNSTPIKVHQFYYNDPEALPERLSPSQDHWGYFNGADNEDYVPVDNQTRDINGAFAFYGVGGDREPNSAYSGKGILTKVVYPTGGYSRFEWSPNTFYGQREVFPPDTTIIFSCHGTEGTPPVEESVLITSPFSQVIELTVSASLIPGYQDTGADVDFEVWNTTLNRVSTSGALKPNEIYSNYVELVEGHGYRFKLVANGESVSGQLYFKYFPSAPNTIQDNIQTGGLRISRIVNHDPVTAKDEVINYYYAKHDQLTKSSGRTSLSTPTYLTQYFTKQNCPGISGAQATCYYASLSSSNKNNMFPVNGSNVFYQYVTVSRGLAGGAGMEEHEFVINFDELGTLAYGNSILNQAPLTNSGWNHGKETSVRYFSIAGQDTILTRKVYNSYKKDPRNYWKVPSLVVQKLYQPTLTQNAIVPCDESNINYLRRVFICKADHDHINFTGNPWDPGTRCIASGHNNQYDTVYTHPCYGRAVGDTVLLPHALDYLNAVEYEYQSHWVYPDKTIETLYDEDGLNPLVRETLFQYDNPVHAQLSRTISESSDGRQLEVVTRYPEDYEPDQIPLVDSLRLKHLVNIPIKQEIIVDSNQVSGEVMVYNTKGQPEEVYSYESTLLKPPLAHDSTQILPPTDYTLKAELTYDTSTGNLKGLQPADNFETVYIWGYHQTLPVFKIENSDYSSVVSALDPTNVENLQDLDANALVSIAETLRSNLPNAGITLYVYDEERRLSQVTDQNGMAAHYEYDDFGRLKLIRDHEGNIIKTYEYNYQLR